MMVTPPLAELPTSEESERAVLASILLRSDILVQVSHLQKDDFHFERHQLIWDAMCYLNQEDQGICIRTLQARLEQVGKFDFVGGVSYLAGLDLDLPDLGRVQFYAGIVKERSIRRQLMFTCSDLSNECLNGLDASEALAMAAERISALQGDHSGSDGPRHISETILDFNRWEPINTGLLGLPTGLTSIDQMLLGLEKGCQYVVAARPGAGKSSLAAVIAVASALTGANVLVMSLEMPEEQWRDRILAQESAAGGHPGISLRRIRTGTIGAPSSAAGQHMVATMQSVSGLPIWIDDRRGLTIGQIAATAASHKMRQGLDLLIVDHLGLIRYKGDQKSKVHQVGETALRLREMAGNLDIPTVTLCQLNRGCEDRASDLGKGVPMLKDLRDSGEIEQHADAVLFIHRQSMYEPDNEEISGLANILIGKQRQGETGYRQVAWLGDVVGFRDLAQNVQSMGSAHGW